MHAAHERCLKPRRPSSCIHIYIAVIALLVQAPAATQAPAREVLNSERIAAAFGSYGIEIVEQDSTLRVSSLFSGTAGEKVCRTFAIVQYASRVDPAIGAEHEAIVAGGSIGAVFASRGWEVRKTHLSYAERPASSEISSLMRIDVGTPVAEHIYVLDVVKNGHSIEYAALVETHHPDYLDVGDLESIYGQVDETRSQLVESLRSIAANRSR